MGLSFKPFGTSNILETWRVLGKGSEDFSMYFSILKCWLLLLVFPLLPAGSRAVSPWILAQDTTPTSTIKTPPVVATRLSNNHHQSSAYPTTHKRFNTQSTTSMRKVTLTKFSDEDVGVRKCRDLHRLLGREVRFELMFTKMNMGFSTLTPAQEEHLQNLGTVIRVL